MQRAAIRQFCTARRKDIYAALAKERNVRSRAAFKLEEMQKKHRFLQRNSRVVDLGAAPGGFSVIAAQHLNLDMREQWSTREKSVMETEIKRTLHGARKKYGRLICVDLQEMDEIGGATFILGDIRAASTQQRIISALRGEEADVVLCDVAPATISDVDTNHIRSVELAHDAFSISQHLLSNGGCMVVKLFSGRDEKEFRQTLEERFVSVKMMKPKASRKMSREIYLIATGFVPRHLTCSERRARESVEEIGTERMMS